MSEATEWIEQSESLGRWARCLLVNRDDAIGRYSAGKGVWTDKAGFNEQSLVDHFKALDGSICGLHAISVDNTCRWFAVDIDHHGDNNPEAASVNELAAIAWYDQLYDLGFLPLLLDSNGRGGFHLWCAFDKPVPSENAHSAALWLTQNWRELGLATRPETFPKQQTLAGIKYGNWLRLPGKHHTREHWARAWYSGSWRTGEIATRVIRSTIGTDPAALPDEATEQVKTPTPRVVKSRIQYDVPRDRIIDRAQRYVDKIDGAVSGERGHDRTFHVACVLTHGFDLSVQDALSIIRAWNSRCEPPWTEAELLHKLEDSAKAPGLRGRLLSRVQSSDGAISIDVPEKPANEVDLDVWRQHSVRNRIRSIGMPVVFVDASPTGAGKSTADGAAIQRVARSLLIVPTHANCREDENKHMAVTDCDVRAYPKRLDEPQTEVCSNCYGNPGEGDIGCICCFGAGVLTFHKNCWNEDAAKAEALGLSIQETVCPSCTHREECNTAGGYLYETRKAAQARLSIATHARAATQGLTELGRGREFASVHETSLNVLRPKMSIDVSDLSTLKDLIDHQLLSDPLWLDHLDQEGFTQVGVEKDRPQHDFANHLLDVLEKLIADVYGAGVSQVIDPPESHLDPPPGFLRILYDLCWRNSVRFKKDTQPLPALLAFAAGKLFCLGVIVTQRPTGSGDETRTEKSVHAITDNSWPYDSPVWFCDATGEVDTIEHCHPGRQVYDGTPAGKLVLQHNTYQVTHDLSRKAEASRVQAYIRGVLARFPDKRRVGIICHRKHIDCVDQLGDAFDVVVKKAYYGSGEDRASNAWHRTCDFLIAAGTPRPGDEAIAVHLLRTGRFEALGLDGDWGDVPWTGKSESGDARLIHGRGYNQVDWQQAHKECVRAHLIQSIGRARGILPDGIPCVVISSEECGISDILDIEPITERDMDVFAVVESQSVNGEPVKTDAIAGQLGKDKSTIRRHLQRLETAGLVERIGQRKGWRRRQRPE